MKKIIKPISFLIIFVIVFGLSYFVYITFFSNSQKWFVNENFHYGLAAEDSVNEQQNEGLKNDVANIEIEQTEPSDDSIASCADFTNRVLTPIKDKQIFVDSNYIEVISTAREAWDASKLLTEVKDLQKQNYICDPMPLESVGPTVITIQWDCELEYRDYNYNYLNNDNLNHKQILENQDFVCEEQICLDKKDEQSFVWLCTKIVEN